MSDIHTIRYFIDAVTGTTKSLQFNAEAPQVCAQDYLEAIAEGDISGHTTYAKYGRVAAVNTTEVDVSSTVTNPYVFPAAAGVQMRLVSTDAADAATGSGVQKVKIEYLDDTLTSQTEEVTLAGTATVMTVSTKIRRLNKVYASACGTSLSPIGTIKIYSTAASTPIYGALEIGLTQSRQLIYTVPINKTLYIFCCHYSSGIGGTSVKTEFVTFTNRATVDPATGGTSAGIFYPFNEIGLTNGAFELNLRTPTKIPGGADLKITVKGDSAQGAPATAAIRGWLE